jgi:hypothetical protein
MRTHWMYRISLAFSLLFSLEGLRVPLFSSSKMIEKALSQRSYSYYASLLMIRKDLLPGCATRAQEIAMGGEYRRKSQRRNPTCGTLV